MKMTKRIVTLLLCLSMLLSLAPSWVLAAEEAYTGTRPTVLMVGGVSVDISQDASGDTWNYDYETNTLTVTGNILVTATTNAKDSGIYVEGDLNVAFSGNTGEIQIDGTYGIYSESGNLHITTAEGTEAYLWTTNAVAIQTSGNVVIDGNGELNAISHANQQGIRANNLTVREVTQLYVDEITVTQSMTVENAFLWCISGASVNGALTIENSHVRMNSKQAAFDSENCSVTDSVIFNGNSIYVAGNAALRANEEFGYGDAVTYGYRATLDTGDYNFSVNANAVIYTTAEDGTVTQHIHNTDGGIDYEDYGDDQYHFTTKICAGCPAGYVYGTTEEHEFGADSLCIYCGAEVRYDLTVGGVMVKHDNAADILGDGTASYDVTTNTLTLNNANIADGVYAEGDMVAGIGILAINALTVELVGDNYVSAASSDTMSIGIFANNALTFSGSGTLTVGCGTGEQISAAIFATSMTVEQDATITAENTVIAIALTNNGKLNALVGRDSPTYTYEVYGDVTLTEDLVVTQGADGDSEYGFIAITEGAVLTISDGVTLTVGGERTDKKDTIINNGKLVLKGTGAIVNNGTGICGEAAVHCYRQAKCLICGAEAIGWTENGGAWYYFDPETKNPVTGIVRIPYPTEAIGGVTYAPNAEDLAGDPSYGYTDGETALFVFDENGVFQNTLNGKYMDGETMHWAVNGQLPWHVGLVQDGEDYYYFLGENHMATGRLYLARNTTELEVVFGGIYTFGADGKMYLYDGIGEVDGTLYYFEDYRLVMGAGLVQVDGNYYYVRSSGAVVTDQRYWVTNVNEYTDITPGFYTFDENGVMEIPEPAKNGIYEENGNLYYYEDGYRVYKGLIQYTDGENYNGEWIYVRSNGQLAVGRYWATKVNDSGMEEGFQTFDQLGRLQPAKMGIVEEYGRLYYYINGVKQYTLGLIILEDGSYIYVRSNGQLATGRYWITNTNGIMEQGFQSFGEDGKMIVP